MDQNEKLGPNVVQEINMVISKYKTLREKYNRSAVSADESGNNVSMAMWYSEVISCNHIIEDLEVLNGRVIQMEEELA